MIRRFVVYTAYFAMVIVLINRLFLIFSLNPDFGGFEPAAVAVISLLVQNGRLYTDPEQLPFISWPHTHVYYYMVSWFSYFFGSDAKAIYILGRTVNVACNILTVYFLIKLIKLFNSNYLNLLLAALSASLVFAAPNMGVRADSLKTFFFILSVYSIIKYFVTSRQLFLLLSGCLSVLAFFTKQDSIILLPISTLLLLKEARYDDLLKYTLIIIISSLVIAVSILTREPYLLNNIVSGVIEFSFNLHSLLGVFSALVSKPVSLIAFSLLFYMLFIRGNINYLGLASMLVVLSSVLFLFKFGSDAVYLTDALLLSIASIHANNRLFGVRTFYLVTALIIGIQLWSYPLWFSFQKERVYANHISDMHSIAKTLSSEDLSAYYVLSYTPSLYNQGLLNRGVMGYLYNYHDFAYVNYGISITDQVHVQYDEENYYKFIKNNTFIVVLPEQVKTNDLVLDDYVEFNKIKTINNYNIYLANL